MLGERQVIMQVRYMEGGWRSLPGPWVRCVSWAVLCLASLVLTHSTALATVSAGNGFYLVFVQDATGSDVGQYTMTTGPLHPAGNGLNVLYGNGNPATSFNTIRSYTTGTDYIQSSGHSSINPTVFLDPYGTVTPLGTTGFRTTYVLPGPPTTPDTMTIIQDVNVNGSTFTDSTIEVTTMIANTGTNSLSVGVRYFWDYQIGADDGPTFLPVTSVDPFIGSCNVDLDEIEYTDPTFQAYRITDNDVNPHPPTFNIFGTVTGPSRVTPLPTQPDLLQYVCWPSAFGSAFEYTITPGRDITTVASDCQSGSGGGDTALNYFFGHDSAHALVIPSGSSTNVSASLFLTATVASSPHFGCITRPARFWFTHQESSDPTCATLRAAIDATCGTLDLGFIVLPTGFRNNDNVKDSEDAMMEALGLYWRSANLTGEIGGTQSSKSRASTLCNRRKKLAVELAAAIANTQLLSTDPSSCTYVNARTNVNFDANLVDEARSTAAGVDPDKIVAMTALLHLFNNSGLANDFPSGLVECSPTKTKTLKSLARDPTTQLLCPGVNNSCGAAETVVFPSSAGSFSSAVFTRSVNLSTYTNSFPPNLTCGLGGRDAVWKIATSMGVSNRSFTVSTYKSNFDTMISIWQGACDALTAVSCTNSVTGVGGETISFRTDGLNTFYIVVEGPSGNIGKTKIKITSP